MLQAILDSSHLISSLRFNLFSNIMPKYLTDDDSPMFSPNTVPCGTPLLSKIQWDSILEKTTI